MADKPSTRPNIVVLSPGFAGSSVLTGLISRAGEYWLGTDTKKVAHETYENAGLVDLDERILREAGYPWYTHPQSNDYLKNIREVADPTLTEDARAFVVECKTHQPWLWKDPRLCYTLPFWNRFVDFSTCKFVVISRDVRQAWIGQILKKRPRTSLKDLQNYFTTMLRGAGLFLSKHGLPHCTVTFDDLLLKPEETIATLNQFLDSGLSVDDLKQIYRGPLYRLRWSRVDFLRAYLRFLTKSLLRIK